jgi:hypothetical protein
LYERFCLLATALNLPSWNGGCFRPFLDEMKSRMENKAVRLCELLPRLSIESSLDAIGRASVMLSWQRTLETFDRIQTQQDLEESAWELIDMLAACCEPSAGDMPLAVLPRVCVRTFAVRLQDALRLDAPHAFQLTAELFGASTWLALAGPKPFLPIAEPLYTYRTQVVESQEFAVLEPCAAARQADEEFEALTVSRQLVFQADLAQNESVDQPALLCAASTLAVLRFTDGEFDVVVWKARAAVKALDAIYPVDCRRALAPGSKTHLYYVRVRTALYATLVQYGDPTEAEAEREILVARGREYRAEYERLLKAWAPKYSKPQYRTALRLIS